MAINRLFYCLLLILWSISLMATSPPSSNIKALDSTISTLTNRIEKANETKSSLTHSLSNTEKKINETITHQHFLEADLSKTTHTIHSLENDLHQLNKAVKNQQTQLALHVKHHYFLGQYSALKWFFKEQQFSEWQRFMTYDTYLVKERQSLIDSISNTKKMIRAKENTLKTTLTQKNDVIHQLISQNNQLKISKQKQHSLIETLNKTISTHEDKLKEAQKNREKLVQLLARLAEQERNRQRQQHSQNNHATTQTPTSSPQLKGKWPRPVKLGRIEQERHGLRFIANEGTPIYAVSNGRVVFSNWLNGYGLLLILDHGNGYLSLYAHNQVLFKHKGDIISPNEMIAKMGHTGGGGKNGLYFEIRYRGKTTEARRLLA